MRAGLEHILANPIIVKSARSRLRPRHMVSWGIVVLTITGFITAIVYLAQVEQDVGTPEQAARWTLLPVIIIQAVVLMLLGTGAVASGISQERDEGLLDYQRMTPMSPTAKLLGYLFGLPVREYFLFALTLPFLGFAVIKGNFELTTVGHFYVIFFSSVLVYHMTGMTAGMASSRPRLAGLIAQGMVLILYFVLPLLSHLGLTFFEFLTIRPALFGLITEEVERMGGSVEVMARSKFTALDSFRDIPFFGVYLHPSMFSLMVQSGLIVTLWTVVHRKWRDQGAHPFSKTFGLAFFAGATGFLLGSVWPILQRDEVLAQLIGHFEPHHTMTLEEAMSQPEVPIITTMIIMVSAGVMGAIALLTLVLTTPTRHTVKRAWRRIERRGKRSVPLTWDGASSSALSIGCISVLGLALGVMIRLALAGGRFEQSPSLGVLIAPGIYVGLIILFLQGALERFGQRAFAVATFVLWMVPFFTAVLLAAAFEFEIGFGFTSLPFPPAGLFYMGVGMLLEGAPSLDLHDDEGPTWIIAHTGLLTMTAIAAYASLAASAQFMSRAQHRRIRDSVLQTGDSNNGAIGA